MARNKSGLTAAFVASVRKPGKYCDRHGLLLRVYPTGARCWEQRITVNGRRRTFGLGPAEVVTLAQAREAALENRRVVRNGGDPGAARRKSGEPTLAAAAAACKQMSVGWTGDREEINWMHSFENHVFPALGKRRVSDIEPKEVLAALLPLWKDRVSTAKRVRQRLSVVFKWAIANGYRRDDPAGVAIAGGLPRVGKRVKRHHAALPHAQVGRAVGLVRRSCASRNVVLALEFLVLTAARSREVRCARWKEIDFETRVWMLPAERMKAREAHTVPLSASAVAVLEQARSFGGRSGSDAIFATRDGRFFGDRSLAKLMKDLSLEGVPHGFRSSFRDWCADTGVDRECAEACLAHTVGNQVEQAYKRTSMVDRRRPVMEAWAKYVERGAASPETQGNSAQDGEAPSGRAVRRRRRVLPKADAGDGALIQQSLFG